MEMHIKVYVGNSLKIDKRITEVLSKIGRLLREVWPIQVLEYSTQIPMQQHGDQVSICS